MIRYNTRKKAGFTLAETLLAMMLLLIASALLATGIPVAFNAYKKVTLTAEANVLISTTMTELRDKLAFSENISVDDSKKIITFTSNNGRDYSLKFDATVNGLYVNDLTENDYNPESGGTYISDSHLLVSDEAAAKDLCVDYASVEKDGDVLIFSNLGVYRKSDTNHAAVKPLVLISEYDVRLVNGD